MEVEGSSRERGSWLEVLGDLSNYGLASINAKTLKGTSKEMAGPLFDHRDPTHAAVVSGPALSG